VTPTPRAPNPRRINSVKDRILPDRSHRSAASERTASRVAGTRRGGSAVSTEDDALSSSFTTVCDVLAAGRLSRTQIDQIEAIQRRALRIIYSDMSYINALYCASIPSLVDRREQLSRKYFTSLLQPSSCPHILLPTPRDAIITTRLRSANKCPRLPSRIRKYQTFISYALAHYQTS